ncbi:MAG: fructose-6-phosphate aldolase [Syntrophomonadaceae bacterium]|jgi:transaldolase|nr:fructose-6-phosphate aldolase [Syntrophomonadaceae bacterium]
MRLFIDTANIEEIREVNNWGVISGVTTNPSLVAREGRDFATVVREICDLVEGPVSAEVLSLHTDEMVREGKQLAALHPQVVVKIPVCEAGLAAIRQLSRQGVSTNATLVFSAAQALLAARAGASYVSPFVGRVDDTGNDGLQVLSEIVTVFDHYLIDTEIIAASIRHPVHVVEAAKMGAHIATVPYSVLKQMVRHPLTEVGITRFLDDWKAAQR